MKDGYHHGDLEAALLDAAVEQVRQRGTAQVSLRGLAKAVGVSPSAAYQHFPDKSSLLRAVGMRAFEALEARMRRELQTVTAPGDLGAVRRFEAVGRAYVWHALEEPHLFRHMFSSIMCETAPPLEPATDWAQAATSKGVEFGEGAHGILLETLGELSRRGLLRDGISEGLDVVAWSLVHGFSSLVVERHMPREAEDLLIGLVARLLLNEQAHAALAAGQAADDQPATPTPG